LKNIIIESSSKEPKTKNIQCFKSVEKWHYSCKGELLLVRRLLKKPTHCITIITENLFFDYGWPRIIIQSEKRHQLFIELLLFPLFEGALVFVISSSLQLLSTVSPLLLVIPLLASPALALISNCQLGIVILIIVAIYFSLVVVTTTTCHQHPSFHFKIQIGVFYILKFYIL